MNFWKRRRSISDGTVDGMIKIRGGIRRDLNLSAQVNTNPHGHRTFIPRGLNRQMFGIVNGDRGDSGFDYNGYNRGEFYRYLRDKIPIINTGVWTWVRLCATNMTQHIEGAKPQRDQAEKQLEELETKLLEAPYGRGSGLMKLTEAYFLELFTTGKFAGEVILNEDGKSIDHFKFIDPYLVGWEYTNDCWQPMVRNLETDEMEPVDPDRFFYSTLGVDLTNPGGSEPLASIPFVVEIEQLMLEDMARSSHNAGTPRLQVKITRPERYSWEGDEQYSNRANTYFRDVLNEFKNLEPDDNIFTWSDVEVTVVGESGIGNHWRLGREQVIEDVITGLKLFPWILGRSHKTTKNWVQCQFDLLMLMVDAHQKSGTDLIDWICNLQLQLSGVEAGVNHVFEQLPDPFRNERARAEQQELENIDFKVRRGYISKDDGAVEMGLNEAYNSESKEE